MLTRFGTEDATECFTGYLVGSRHRFQKTVKSVLKSENKCADLGLRSVYRFSGHELLLF